MCLLSPNTAVQTQQDFAQHTIGGPFHLRVTQGHSGIVNMRAEYALNEQSTCPTWHTALEIDNTTM